jgi:predicted nucleic acid-binding protein
MSETIIITDTSVLINFLVLDRAELLTGLPNQRFVVTDHVRAEVTAHYPEQLQRLEEAFAKGILEEISVTEVEEVSLFARLTAEGLGIGECSAIAVASHRKLALAIDDKRAVKKLTNLGLGLTIFSTELLVVLLIRETVLTVAEADAMKAEWEKNHRFRLTFASFADRIRPTE